MTPLLSYAEEDVQRIALEHLSRYYQSKSSNRNIYYTDEAFTRDRAYRADGLIAIHQSQHKILTVSLEVKRQHTQRRAGCPAPGAAIAAIRPGRE